MEATFRDIPYGPHERNVLDLHRPVTPTGAVLSWIHGGSFYSGDKSNSAKLDLLRGLHGRGVSIVTTNYRFSQHAEFPAPFHDCRRALQFVRHHASSWNLDSGKVALGGASAGAGMALWLGLKPDMADTSSIDSIKRESTRPKCVLMSNGQTSYDPEFLAKEIGDRHISSGALSALFGVPREVWPKLDSAQRELVEEASPINHLTEDASPVFSTYSMDADAPPDIHHPRFSLCLRDRMEVLGCECTVLADADLGIRADLKASMIDGASSFLDRHVSARNAEA